MKLAERPRRGEEFESPEVLGAPARPRPAQPEPQLPLGVSVREMDRGFVGRLEIPDSIQGVVVSRVEPTGPAHQVLRRGLVIIEINRRPTRSRAEYQQVVSGVRGGDVLAIYYYDPTLGRRGLVTVTAD